MKPSVFQDKFTVELFSRNFARPDLVVRRLSFSFARPCRCHSNVDHNSRETNDEEQTVRSIDAQIFEQNEKSSVAKEKFVGLENETVWFFLCVSISVNSFQLSSKLKKRPATMIEVTCRRFTTKVKLTKVRLRSSI